MTPLHTSVLISSCLTSGVSMASPFVHCEFGDPQFTTGDATIFEAA